MDNIEPWATKKYKRFNIGDEVKIKQYNYMLFRATRPATIVGINTKNRVSFFFIFVSCCKFGKEELSTIFFDFCHTNVSTTWI